MARGDGLENGWRGGIVKEKEVAMGDGPIKVIDLDNEHGTPGRHHYHNDPEMTIMEKAILVIAMIAGVAAVVALAMWGGGR